MSKLLELLGNEADSLLNHRCQTIACEHLHLPGPDVVDRIFLHSDRNPRVLASIQRLISCGRLRNTDPVVKTKPHVSGLDVKPDKPPEHVTIDE